MMKHLLRCVQGGNCKFCVFVCVCARACQTVGEREAEARTTQEELTRLRQEVQEKSSQEETLRHQMAEKEERTKKAMIAARQKIRQVIGEVTLPGSGRPCSLHTVNEHSTYI